MSGSHSRRKGQTGEQELCRLLRAGLGIEVERNLLQSRSGGHDIELPGIGLEVKRAATVNAAMVRVWWKQAVRQADTAKLCPALAYRADRQPWTVRLPLVALGPELLGELTVDLGLDGFLALLGSGWRP